MRDVLRIITDVGTHTEFNLRIVDQLGKSIMETSVMLDHHTPIELNVSVLKEGIYFLQLTAKGQSVTSKFVKRD